MVWKLLFLAGCMSFGSQFAYAQVKQTSRSYVHSVNGVPKNLDPVQVDSYYASIITDSIYDRFYSYRYLQRPYQLKASLAVGMPEISTDGKVYTLRIKRGIYFADNACFKGGLGREVSVRDFVYTMKRHMDPRQRSTSPSGWEIIKGMSEWKKKRDYSQRVKGLEVIDDYTLKVTLNKPWPRFVNELATTGSAFIPHEAVTHYGPEFAIHPAGSGPYSLAAFNKTKAELVRNPKYRREVFDLKEEGYNKSVHVGYGIEALAGQRLPRLDKIIVRFMNQETSRWNSFTKGDEINFSTIPSDLTEQILESVNPPTLKQEYAKKYVLSPERDIGVTFSAFNMANPEIGFNKNAKRNAANRALRCSIRKAFNWPSRIQRFYYGLGEAYAGIISPSLQGYTPISSESVKLDVRHAKELLREHGWNRRNLPVINYAGTASVKHRQMFEQFRGFLRKIGYPRQKIRYKVASTFGNYLQRINAGEFDYFGMGWIPSVPDPEELLERYYSKSWSPGANKSRFIDERYDQLFEQVIAMESGPERRRLMKQMNQLVTAACVAVESFSRTTLNIWHKDVNMLFTSNMLRDQFKYIDFKKEDLTH